MFFQLLQIDGKISVRDPDGHGAVEQIGDRRFFGFKIVDRERFSVRIDDPEVLREPRLAVFLGDTRIGLAAKTVPNSSDFSFDPEK